MGQKFIHMSPAVMKHDAYDNIILLKMYVLSGKTSQTAASDGTE